MTNKTKVIAGGVAAALAVAATGTFVATRDSGPPPYVFNGFAEATQLQWVEWADGTNRFGAEFEFNPDRSMTVEQVVTNRAWVPRLVTERHGGEPKLVERLYPMEVAQTNKVELFPGTVMVWKNGERIGTNIAAAYVPGPPLLDYLRWLGSQAEAAESQ